MKIIVLQDPHTFRTKIIRRGEGFPVEPGYDLRLNADKSVLWKVLAVGQGRGRRSKKLATAFFAALVIATLAVVPMSAQPGPYTERQLIKLLVKTFPDWQGDKSEKLIFITEDGQLFAFGSGGLKGVSGSLPDIVRTLARGGQRLGTVTNVVHSREWPDGFSPTDVAFYRTLRKAGFTGAFQLFYPERHRIKTLKGEGK